MNYNPSTIARVSDIGQGLQVQTGVLTGTVHMVQNQVELFNVYGRIKLTQLFVEVLTALADVATTLQFNYTGATPVVTVKPLTGASGALNSLPQGGRVMWLGGAVATAAGITVATGICSDLTNIKAALLGAEDGVMTIGMLTAAANATGGTARAWLRYYQDTPGAYVTAVL